MRSISVLEINAYSHLRFNTDSSNYDTSEADSTNLTYLEFRELFKRRRREYLLM